MLCLIREFCNRELVSDLANAIIYDYYYNDQSTWMINHVISYAIMNKIEKMVNVDPFGMQYHDIDKLETMTFMGFDQKCTKKDGICTICHMDNDSTSKIGVYGVAYSLWDDNKVNSLSMSVIYHNKCYNAYVYDGKDCIDDILDDACKMTM